MGNSTQTSKNIQIKDQPDFSLSEVCNFHKYFNAFKNYLICIKFKYISLIKFPGWIIEPARKYSYSYIWFLWTLDISVSKYSGIFVCLAAKIMTVYFFIKEITYPSTSENQILNSKFELLIIVQNWVQRCNKTKTNQF